MKIVDGIYRNTIELNSHDVDAFNAVHPAFYFRVMQEAAGMHAYLKQVSIPQLQLEGKTWVVTRTKMTITHYLSWPNSLEVTTWPQTPWKFYYPRVCRAESTTGELLFESMSHWVVMDVAKMRPIRDAVINSSFEAVENALFRDPDLGNRSDFDATAASPLFTYTPKINYSDVDLNQHVNNVVYLQWMLASLPFAFRDEWLIASIDISYRAQAFRDDNIVVMTGGRAPTLYHKIETKEGKIVATATTSWRPRTQ